MRFAFYVPSGGSSVIVGANADQGSPCCRKLVGLLPVKRKDAEGWGCRYEAPVLVSQTCFWRLEVTIALMRSLWKQGTPSLVNFVPTRNSGLPRHIPPAPRALSSVPSAASV